MHRTHLPEERKICRNSQTTELRKRMKTEEFIKIIKPHNGYGN